MQLVENELTKAHVPVVDEDWHTEFSAPGLRVIDFTYAMVEFDQLGLADFADYGFDEQVLGSLRQRFADWPRNERATMKAVWFMRLSPRRNDEPKRAWYGRPHF